ncbi:MAG: hypothetical protein ACT4OK_01095, partial [Gemmobacter sp.]
RRPAEAIRQQPNPATNAGKNRFETHADRARFIAAFADADNRTGLRCIANRAPLDALCNQTKHNTRAGTSIPCAPTIGTPAIAGATGRGMNQSERERL